VTMSETTLDGYWRNWFLDKLWAYFRLKNDEDESGKVRQLNILTTEPLDVQETIVALISISCADFQLQYSADMFSRDISSTYISMHRPIRAWLKVCSVDSICRPLRARTPNANCNTFDVSAFTFAVDNFHVVSSLQLSSVLVIYLSCLLRHST